MYFVNNLNLLRNTSIHILYLQALIEYEYNDK